MPAELEAPGPGEGLAEDQAGPVVEGFKGLGIELGRGALLAPWLGACSFGRPASGGSLAQNAVQPAARDESCVRGWGAHLLSFLSLLSI